MSLVGESNASEKKDKEGEEKKKKKKKKKKKNASWVEVNRTHREESTMPL